MLRRPGTYIFAAVIYLLWIAAVFDPIGKFLMLRYAALAGAIACLVLSGGYLRLFYLDMRLRNFAIVYISLVMPLYGFIVYAMRGGYASGFIDTSYAAAGVLLSISLIYKDEDLCGAGMRAMVFSLRLLVFAAILTYAIAALDRNSKWVSFVIDRDIAVIGIREYASATLPYIYFVASPMLIYLIGYDLNRLSGAFSVKNILTCGASIFALALSGTRAHMILAAAYVPVFYLMYSRRKLILIPAFVLLAALSIGVFDVKILRAFFSAEEVNNSMKLGMLSNYGDILNDPLTFIFGQGYNAHAWSSSLREVIAAEVGASKTELTYLEILRVYGLLISMPFFFIIGVLVHGLSRLTDEHRWLYPAHLIYLINSCVNPYLFSTNGMLPLGLILAVLSMKRKSGFATGNLYSPLMEPTGETQ